MNMVFDDDKIEVMHKLSSKTAPALIALGKPVNKSKKNEGEDLMKNPEFDNKVAFNYPEFFTTHTLPPSLLKWGIGESRARVLEHSARAVTDRRIRCHHNQLPNTTCIPTTLQICH